MRIAFLSILLVAGVLSGCSEDQPPGADEVVSRPDKPQGADTAYSQEPESYSSGGATSSQGHAVEYRFDFDADSLHNYSGWNSTPIASKSWPDTGSFAVKAQARCATHAENTSLWSDGKPVTVIIAPVSRPNRPTGTTDTQPDSSEIYCTGGSINRDGHPVEYRFDLDAEGSHSFSAWDTLACVSHSWPSEGVYVVKARARSAIDTAVVSHWSDGTAVTVAHEFISTPDVPTGPVIGAYPAADETYCTGGASSNRGHPLEYRFDFGDVQNRYSDWEDSGCADHYWWSQGTLIVRAQARCAWHPSCVSPWSNGMPVLVISGAAHPAMRFTTHIDGVSKPYSPIVIPFDTVGMFRPFAISYHGVPARGFISAYRYFPLSTSIDIPGSNIWSTDLSDTIRTFRNNGVDDGNPLTADDILPSGVFKFAAQCKDDSNRVSPVDPGGSVQLVVNFDPDTRILVVENSYSIGNNHYSREIDFEDGAPDTVSYKSWVKLVYSGWDDDRDSLACSPLDPDRCLDYQIRYFISRDTGGFSFSEDSRWLPPGDVHDTDPLSAVDSNSVSIGSLEYRLFVRSIDEYGRGDGTPPSVDIVGNFVPTLDSAAVEDHLGRRLDLSVVDTLTWNFWKGEGWPYTCVCDTLDLGAAGSCPDHDCPPGNGTLDFFKSFSFHIKAWGHDHHMDPSGSGVKAWQYLIHDSDNNLLPLGESGGGWFNAVAVDELDGVIRVRFYYPGPATPNPDPMGDTVFDNLPSWFDDDLTITLWGRDTLAKGQEGSFQQFVFLNGQQWLINEFAAGSLGRVTEKETFTFHVRLVRP